MICYNTLELIPKYETNCSKRRKKVLKLMFENTIFDNTRPVKQTEMFEYASILIPLNKNPKMTILIWERLCKMLSDEDESSLRNSDME